MLKAAMLVVVMAITKLPISAAIKNDEGDVSDNVIPLFLNLLISSQGTDFINFSPPKAP